MIFGMMLSWLLMIGAALMTLGLSINAIWRAVMPPSGLPRGAGCGSCGYELTTLEAGRCSECGADLIKSGVTTRRNAVRSAGSLPAALMGWTIIMIVLGSIAFGIGISVVTMNNFAGAGGAAQALVNTQSFRPDRFDPDGDGIRTRSAEYEVTVVFDGEYSWNGNSAQTGTVTIGVEGDDVTTPLTLEFDVETDEFTIKGADGTVLDSGLGFSEGDAGLLLATAGLDTTDAGLSEEAEQVGALFIGALDDPMNFESVALFNVTTTVGGLSSSGGSTNFGGGMGMTGLGTSSAELIAAGVIGVVLLFVYGVGIAFIVRRRGRLLAPPRNDGPGLAAC